MKRRSPQEKKALSYAKDRRNTYGENDKSSRKAIRVNKRLPHRADRHREHRLLGAVTGAYDDVRAEQADSAPPRRAGRWRKLADAPLAETVIHRLQRRARLGMIDPASAEAAIHRVRRTTRQK